MKKLTVTVKEVSYGFVEIEMPDDATEEQVIEKTNKLYGHGCVSWGKTDFTVLDIT